MRYMTMVKADEGFEAGAPPSPALMEAIGTLSEELARAGVLLQVGGLLPSASGFRLHARDGRITATDGPFTEAKELIGGFAIMEAASREEALEHARRFLQVHVEVLGPDYRGEVEVRPMYDEPGRGDAYCAAEGP
jgi:hypothetical protein